VKRCTVCSAIYPANHAFCKVDGTALVDAPDFAAGVPQPVPQSWQPSAAKRPVPVWVWVLVGVAAFLFLIIPLLAVLAIPTLGAARKTANEHAAKQAMREIQQAEAMYEQEYPANGYACSLAALGGDPKAGAPSPAAAQLIQPDLASGVRNSYVFSIGKCTQVSYGGVDRIVNYTVFAVPVTIGKSGNRGFCADDAGIKFDPTGGTNCTQLVQ
jgi:type IV pilus assembly protein PilA